MRTQVGIVGSGPAGLLLSQALAQHGVESIIVERQNRQHVEGRIRAGVLEQGTVDLLREIGAADRLDQNGLVHEGTDICLHGKRHRVDFLELTGKCVTVYGQTEITKDLIRARLADGEIIHFAADQVEVHEIETTKPRITYALDGEAHQLECDFVAGCDGFHGVCRRSFPGGTATVYERRYPFAWLGILAEAVPPSEELIYAASERGFALFSMRSPTLSRNYIQCSPEEDLDEWPDQRIWEELALRLGERNAECLTPGQVLDKGVTQMRSFVVEPMQSGRLFLAGDAAHIVPPTGAKGLNLAAADVHYLADGLIHYYQTGSMDRLDRYTMDALDRVWKAQRFSWWMTSMLHNAPGEEDFERRVRRAELEYVLSSRAAMTSLAENYVGLPFYDD